MRYILVKGGSVNSTVQIEQLIQYNQNVSSIYFCMIKRKEQWITYGKQTKKNLFFFQDKVLDLTYFMSEHPGGKKALGNYIFKDVTDIVFSVYPHKRQTTIAKLNNYVIGRIPVSDTKNPKIERSLTPPKEKEKKKKVCFAKKGAGSSHKDLKKDESSKISKENTRDGSSKSKHHQQGSEKKQRSKGKSKSKQKISSGKDIKKKEEPFSLTSIKNISDDLDEEKPVFKVPILCVKHMGQLG